MNQDDMYKTLLKVYKKCKITSFPLDCFCILDKYHLSCIPYSTLSDKKRAICLDVSHDAFMAKETIFYNDSMPKERIRFSLMHEFAHYILKHEEESEEHEQEADCFASMILAPMILIHELERNSVTKKITADDIRNHFGVSITAANTYVVNYHKWFLNIAHTTRKPTDIELSIKNLFIEQPAPTKRRITQQNNRCLHYFMDSSNDNYIRNQMERRRTEPY